MKLTYPNSACLRVSPETIYKSLYIQTRELFDKNLRNHLRTKRKFRHAKKHKMGSRGRIVNAISINERPLSIESRAVPGHWEGDLILGSKNSYIATVVERQTRFTILVKVRDKSTHSVVSALTKQMNKLPLMLKKSLTWDRGTELASHEKFTLKTKIPVYFCDPKSPWQRGTNENTNGLLRKYFPKKTCLQEFTQQDLNLIAAKLNCRPRKVLGFLSPDDKLSHVLR